MEKRILLLGIIFFILISLILLSGCISEGRVPVATINAEVRREFQSVSLNGRIAFPFCKANNTMFVYDTESHENWEDYNFTIEADISGARFAVRIFDDEVEHYKTHYFRAVAYCYDFKGPLRNYEEGYYAGIEKTFYINWD